jgi:hypothetical protein
MVVVVHHGLAEDARRVALGEGIGRAAGQSGKQWLGESSESKEGSRGQVAVAPSGHGSWHRKDDPTDRESLDGRGDRKAVVRTFGGCARAREVRQHHGEAEDVCLLQTRGAWDVPSCQTGLACGLHFVFLHRSGEEVEGSAAARPCPCALCSGRDDIRCRGAVSAHPRGARMDRQAVARGTCPLTCPCPKTPWAGCLVAAAARRTCDPNPVMGRQKRVARGRPAAFRTAAPPASNIGHVATGRHCRAHRTVSGGRASAVCGKEDTRPGRTVCACAERRASTSHTGALKLWRRKARRSVTAEAASPATQVADHQASTISTWSCRRHYWT